MENTSINKRKRGRPAKYSSEHYDAVEALTNGKSNRQKQNFCHALNAAGVLKRDKTGDFSYLFEPCQRTTILSALGRIGNKAGIVQAAKLICKDRVGTRRALNIIIRARGKEQPSTIGMFRAIDRAIVNYHQQHDGVSKKDILSALKHVAKFYSSNM